MGWVSGVNDDGMKDLCRQYVSTRFLLSPIYSEDGICLFVRLLLLSTLNYGNLAMTTSVLENGRCTKWDSNPRPEGLDPDSSALDLSAIRACFLRDASRQATRFR